VLSKIKTCDAWDISIKYMETKTLIKDKNTKT
jgi:hypothetical protein